MPEKEFIKIDRSKGVVNLGVWFVKFKDIDHFIAYVPSLKISAYGDSEQEAEKMLMEDVMRDYMVQLLENPEGSVSEELQKYGWKKSGYFRKKFFNDRPPMDRSAILKNFNLPEETQIKSQFIAA